MRKENRRKEIEKLWKLCKETNVMENGTILHTSCMRMENELKRRLTHNIYFKMSVVITCFANHAQDKRFANLLLKKLDDYYEKTK